MAARLEFSRENFYEMVWSKPALKLAVELEITTTDLAAICRGFDIPRPPSTHWAKLAKGKPSTQPPLPLNSKGTGETVHIWGKSNPKVPLPIVQVTSDEVKKPEKQDIRMKDDAVKLHRIVSDLLKEHKDELSRRQKNGYNPFVRYDAARYLEDNLRLYRALDALLRGLEAAGGRFENRSEDQITVNIRGQLIRFKVRWRLRRHHAKLPPDRWRLPGDKDYETTLVPTKNIVVFIDEWFSGVPKEWVETDTKRFENSVHQIVDIFLRSALVMEQAKQAAIEQRKRDEIERARLAEIAERERIDSDRWSGLISAADTFERMNKVRAFLNELRSCDFDPDQVVGDMTIKEWFAWADEKLKEEEGLSDGPSGLFRRLAERAKTPKWNPMKIR